MTHMVELDDLVKRVRSSANACPLPLVERAIVEAARELCEKAPVWRDTDEVVFSETDPCTYMCALRDASIVRIEKAAFDGSVLTAILADELDNIYPNWDVPGSNKDSSHPSYYVQTNIDTIQVYPRKAGSLWLRLVLKPALEAVTLPDVLVEQYGEIIAKGATAKVLLTPNADFQNPMLGAELQAQFNSGLGPIKIKAIRSQTNAKLRTKPSYY